MVETERRKLNELVDFVSYIDHLSDLAIVEGPHDKKTLRFLGYEGPIIEVSKISIDDLVKIIEGKYSNMIILTDFDEEGKRMENLIELKIKDKDIEILTELRTEFEEILDDLNLSTIEGIYGAKIRAFG